MNITADQIKKISLNHGRDDICQVVAQGITELGSKFFLDTALRVKHFLGQICIESSFFSRLDENLNYSAQRLVQVWPSHFNSKTAPLYANNPQKLANFIYGQVLASTLGNTGPNDGYLYRGGGLPQLTGRENYTEFNKWMRDNVPNSPDFVTNPELVRTIEWCLYPALWFWTDKECYKYADNDDAKGVTRAINGGLNGFDDRNQATALAGKVLNMPTQSKPTAVKQTVADPLLKEYQSKLITLSITMKQSNFNPGSADGWNGPKTTAAISALQTYANLKVDGIIGPNTRNAIDQLLCKYPA